MRQVIRDAAGTAVPRRERLAEYVAFESNVATVSGAMFLMGLGEELWRRFVPKYLEALGAPVTAIGLYGTARDFLDGAYQYPGGWIADRHGRRTALFISVSLAAVGYGVYAFASAWQTLFVGLVFVMGWSSMASPTLFAVVGDALPPERRTMGFTVQSILRRVPIIIAPTLGGLLIATHGVRAGVRTALVFTIVVALLTLALVSRIRVLPLTGAAPMGMRGVWRELPKPLKRLLVSDILARSCEGLVDVFLVLYAMNVVGIDTVQYGVLVAIQMVTAVVLYLPAARMADRIGRIPFVIATFLAFALFPLAVVLATSFLGLLAAFVVGGLREIGEPARKAMIVDLAAPHLRARSVGMYYLVRCVAITPASFTGGLLWGFDPVLPFMLAFGVGLAGTVVFAATAWELATP